MEQRKLESLKRSAQHGKPLDPGAVLELISEHETLVRSEAFWGARAPKMNEELLILRQLESPARAHVAQDPKHKRTKEFAPALAQLDELRAVGKGST